VKTVIAVEMHRRRLQIYPFICVDINTQHRQHINVDSRLNFDIDGSDRIDVGEIIDD
jgi:hypothetical protein